MFRTFTILFALALPCSAWAMEQVTIQKDGKRKVVNGRIEVEAKDGGLLLLGQDGKLWALQPGDIAKRKSNDLEFAPLSVDEQSKALMAELPDGFAIHKTAHYLICYNTSKAYAQWCGSLYERLHRGFYNYWRKRGMELHDPDTMLVAVVFDSESSYAEYGRDELGDAAKSIVGYYSLQSNRIATYDLTGHGDVRAANGRRPGTSAVINDILSQPSAAPTVATTIHEATHQLAYNSGLQTRYADNPLWLSEGLAIYFETPDLGSKRGWRGIGAVNSVRLNQFRQDLANGNRQPLLELLTNDKLLRSSDTALGGYAQSWGLCYYLAKRHPKQLAKYLAELSEKPPLGKDTAEEKLKLFQEHFGTDLDKFERRFVSYLANLKSR